MSKAGYPQPKDEVVGGGCELSIFSCQLSALEVILKFEDLEVRTQQIPKEDKLISICCY
jgi:hypothetical protein